MSKCIGQQVKAISGMILGTELKCLSLSFQVSNNSAPNIWSAEVSYSITPSLILIISMFHSYFSHKSSKVMRVCILYLLSSALAPFHCKIFVEMFITIS